MIRVRFVRSGFSFLPYSSSLPASFPPAVTSLSLTFILTFRFAPQLPSYVLSNRCSVAPPHHGAFGCRSHAGFWAAGRQPHPDPLSSERSWPCGGSCSSSILCSARPFVHLTSFSRMGKIRVFMLCRRCPPSSSLPFSVTTQRQVERNSLGNSKTHTLQLAQRFSCHPILLLPSR